MGSQMHYSINTQAEYLTPASISVNLADSKFICFTRLTHSLENRNACLIET